MDSKKRKSEKMGSGCCKFKEGEADKCARVGREEEDTSSNRPELGGFVPALQSAALSEDVLLRVTMKQFCVPSRSGWDREARRRKP